MNQPQFTWVSAMWRTGLAHQSFSSILCLQDSIHPSNLQSGKRLKIWVISKYLVEEELLPPIFPQHSSGAHFGSQSTNQSLVPFLFQNPRLPEWDFLFTDGLALQPGWLSKCGNDLWMVFVGQLNVTYSVKKDSPSSLLAASWVMLWEDVIACWQP